MKINNALKNNFFIGYFFTLANESRRLELHHHLLSVLATSASKFQALQYNELFLLFSNLRTQLFTYWRSKRDGHKLCGINMADQECPRRGICAYNSNFHPPSSALSSALTGREPEGAR